MRTVMAAELHPLSHLLASRTSNHLTPSQSIPKSRQKSSSLQNEPDLQPPSTPLDTLRSPKPAGPPVQQFNPSQCPPLSSVSPLAATAPPPPALSRTSSPLWRALPSSCPLSPPASAPQCPAALSTPRRLSRSSLPGETTRGEEIGSLKNVWKTGP